MLRPVFIIAVSGGVDSVVLLHMIATQVEHTKKTNNNTQDSLGLRPPLYVVTHVDHGIREDSGKDALFVEQLAANYDLQFESTKLNLGSGVSEELARQKRYEYLFSIMKKYKAESVVTAHHQDDVIETMIVNMVRGTGPKGLVGFSQPNILRPLLNKTKDEIKEYARKYSLSWHEDSTNNDQSYLRNEIRQRIIPKLGAKRDELLALRRSIEETTGELDSLTKKLLVQTLERGELVRARFVILPYCVQKELMASWLRISGVEIDKIMIEKAVLAAKTLRIGKHIELSKNIKLLSDKTTLVLKV